MWDERFAGPRCALRLVSLHCRWVAIGIDCIADLGIYSLRFRIAAAHVGRVVRWPTECSTARGSAWPLSPIGIDGIADFGIADLGIADLGPPSADACSTCHCAECFPLAFFVRLLDAGSSVGSNSRHPTP